MSELLIRQATRTDAALLAEIERQSPLVLGGESLVIDRGDDYFAASRLMEDVTILIAELDGEPAGAFCAALHRTLLGGVERSMLYYHHTRILPRFQKHGVGRKLAAALLAHYAGRVDSRYWYVSPANENSQSFTRAAPNRWTIGPALVGIDTLAQAGPMVGRPATRADARRIVELLNAAHRDEEMFLPYTVESLTARLERAPAQYSWSRVWLLGDAVAGVWPEGESIRLRHTDAYGAVTTTRGAAVLDFGCGPGGESSLVALLRGWCGWLAPRDMSELSLFTSPYARHHDLLANLGRLTAFDFWTPEFPQPEAAEQHGLYVDHIYF